MDSRLKSHTCLIPGHSVLDNNPRQVVSHRYASVTKQYKITREGPCSWEGNPLTASIT